MEADIRKNFRNYTCNIKEESKSKVRHDKFFANPLSSFIIMAAVLVLLQALSFIPDFIISTSVMSALGMTVIYSIISIGFCLLLGYGGLASLGTAGFIGVGSYIAYFCFAEWGLPYIVCLAITLAVSIVLGVAVGFISLRIEGIYLAIVTLGLAEILRNALQAIRSTININIRDIKLFGIYISKTVVFFLLVGMFFLLIAITLNLINSPTGRAMLAMKNSTAAAQAYGISLMRYRLLAFVLSTVYASVAGLLYMMYVRSISTSMSTLLKLATSLNILGAVIIGGTKSIWGVTLGTFIIYGLDSLVLQNIPFFRQNPTFISLFIGLLIILVVMFYPGGLAQLGVQIKQWIKRLMKKSREAKYGKDVG